MITTLAQSAPQTVLHPESVYVPIGIAVVVGLFVIGVCIKVVRWLTRIDARLAAMEARFKNEWTRKDQEVFALRLKIANPTLRVPHLQDPDTEIQSSAETG